MFKKSLNKIDIAKNLSSETGLSLNFSKKLIDDLIDFLIINIKKNGFILKNFGTFKLLLKNERIGRNPKTKEKFLISKRKSISFTLSKELSSKIKNLHEKFI